MWGAAAQPGAYTTSAWWCLDSSRTLWAAQNVLRPSTSPKRVKADSFEIAAGRSYHEVIVRFMLLESLTL